MLLDLGIHCLGPMEHISTDLGSRENFSYTLPYASFKICCKQGYSRGGGRHCTMVWNTWKIDHKLLIKINFIYKNHGSLKICHGIWFYKMKTMQNMWYIIFFINVWWILTAIRLPFCSLSHVSRTSGQILMELVWCVLRFWCRSEWTAVEQRASWLAWMFHPQTTVWRWQGPPTAALWRTPYASCPSPKHLPWRILLQWSPLQTTKLHYYY